VQLVYQDWQTDWFPGLAQRMLGQFHAQNPNVRVFYTPDPDDLNERMLADFQAGTAPDVVAGCCEFFPIWAQKGYLLDLRPYVAADLDRATLSDWDKAQYDSFFTAEGLQFALPKYHGALALYYNKDWFDEAGVTYADSSWDHDDYQQAMAQLTRDRGTNSPPDRWGSMVDIAWERIQVHINGWGGHLVDPYNAYRSMMSRPEALEAMQWIRDRMWEDHTMASFLDVKNQETRQVFTQERIAMVEDGSWALKDILENARFRVGVAPFPAGPARKVTLATTDGYAIFAGTKYPDAAWELLKFLTGVEYGRALARDHLLQPARASLVEEWIAAIREEYPEPAAEMDIAAFAEGHLQSYSVVAEVFANMEEARGLALSAWERIFTLGQAPVELMAEVSDQIEELQSASA
jgi:multiple sugar transport system substrate-binding protein